MQLHFYRYQLPLDIDLNIFTFPISLVLLKVIYYNTGPHLLKKRNIFTFFKLIFLIIFFLGVFLPKGFFHFKFMKTIVKINSSNNEILKKCSHVRRVGSRGNIKNFFF